MIHADHRRLYERDEVPARRFSGELRRDFHAITERGKTPAERLALILKHADYQCSGAEYEAAIAAIGCAGLQNTGNVYTILAQLDMAGLQTLARAGKKAFTFEDKYTRIWRSIYCLVGQPVSALPETALIAEVGVTSKPLDELTARLRRPETSRHNTKLGRLLAALGTAYVLPVESHFGDLDDMDIVKEWWRLAGMEQGVRFPEKPSPPVPVRPEKVLRTWPDFDWFAAAGARVR